MSVESGREAAGAEEQGGREARGHPDSPKLGTASILPRLCPPGADLSPPSSRAQRSRLVPGADRPPGGCGWWPTNDTSAAILWTACGCARRPHTDASPEAARATWARLLRRGRPGCGQDGRAGLASQWVGAGGGQRPGGIVWGPAGQAQIRKRLGSIDHPLIQQALTECVPMFRCTRSGGRRRAPLAPVPAPVKVRGWWGLHSADTAKLFPVTEATWSGAETREAGGGRWAWGGPQCGCQQERVQARSRGRGWGWGAGGLLEPIP